MEGPGPSRERAADLDHPDSAWNRAVRTRDQGDPFSCRTEWQLSYHEVFAPTRPLALVRSGDSLVTFAVHHAQDAGPLLEPVESGWCFGCPLLGPDALDLLGELADAPQLHAWRPRIVVSGLQPDGELLTRLLTRFAAPRGYAATELVGTVQVWASLRGGLDGYLARRSAKTRRGVRAAARRVADRGVTFERHRPTTEGEAAALYRRMVAVERRSWKGLGRCGMAEPGSLQFYAAMMRRLSASGGGRVILAVHPDDGDVGFVFGGMHDRVYRGQQFSYVEGWRDASLGNVLQLEQLRWLGDEGAERYDMGPDMDYKRHWTEGRTALTTLLLRPDGP